MKGTNRIIMNSTSLSLNGSWELLERPLEDGAEAFEQVADAPASFQAEVPGDVNDALVQAGALPEPLQGLNFRRFPERVTTRSWWFRKRFVVTPEALARAAAELSLDGLDVHADIWLNGQHLGHHASAFLPFVRHVTAHLCEGENVLLVRLTTGAERVSQHTAADFPLLPAVPTEAGRGYRDRGFPQRIFLRKPAYTWGWDWSPHLPTCGITGECGLRFMDVNVVRTVFLRPSLQGRNAHVQAEVELERHTLTGTTWGRVVVELTDEKGVTHQAVADEVLVNSGITVVPLTLTIARPRLWWPNGAGEQHRYTVRVRLQTDTGRAELAPFRWGLRTVELDVKPGRFRFRVNGTPLFLKGGNWIPCDHLYGRTTPERLQQLVREAATANFNTLRVWGGGRFEREAFFEACDEAGILLWHDFMSACAPLPGDEAFTALFCREAEHQVRRLHNRACMLLWCGNNEVGACYNWFKEAFAQQRDPAWPLYFEHLPRLVHRLAPHIPYWPTSPYGGPSSVGDLTTGDDHHWVVMRAESEYWSNPEYWDTADISIFNSEYGYGGPCSRASTEQYLDSASPALDGETGREHTNTFYDIPRVNFSIKQHYRDPDGMTLDAYILHGGLCQGLNLGYSLESMRANRHTWGGIFWMYNDAWGENGWTIIDYYLRRKVSYYNVKRCLAPRRLVLRRGGQGFGGREDEVLLIALNDGATPLRQTIQFGYLRYDGKDAALDSVQIDVPARSKRVIASCNMPDADRLAHGTVVAWPAHTAALEPVSWRHCTFKQSALPPATVRVVATRRRGDTVRVTLASTGFAHAVYLNVGDDAHPSDHFFDMLPGERRTVSIPAAELPGDWAPQVSCVQYDPSG